MESPPFSIKCEIAYAGTHYYGFQKTSMGPTIEEELEKALSQILQHPITIQAASRTDRGVHAEGQVIQFTTSKTPNLHTFYASLRSLLPPDIVPLKLELVSPTFHPSLDSLGKEYHYFLCENEAQLPQNRDYSWHVHTPLNIADMQKASRLLIGTHDFSSFTTLAYDDPIRTLKHIGIKPIEEGRYLISITGDNFLYKMVRNLVGTLVHIGQGKIPLSNLPHILKSQDRRLAGVTAPPHGLFLKRVFH